MPRSSTDASLWKGALAGLAGGLVGSYIKGLAEPVLQDLGESLFPSAPRALRRPGADIQGHPAQMPPAQLAQAATDHYLAQDERLAVQERIHYAFGTAFGGLYGALAEATPVGQGYGLPSAVALWLGTHGTALPALGLQADPDDLPPATHVWELGSHLVYGLTVDVVRRLVRRVL